MKRKEDVWKKRKTKGMENTEKEGGAIGDEVVYSVG